MLEARPSIDSEEFRKLTEKLVTRAERGAGRIAMVPKDDAEDVVQDGWEREVRKRKKRRTDFPRGDELAAHMSATVADMSIEHQRRVRRKKEVPPEMRTSLSLVPDAASAVVGGDVEEEVLAKLAAEELAVVISEELDPLAQRQAILAALDYTEPEMAETLSLPRSDIDAARHRLKRRSRLIAERTNQTLSERREDD